MSIQIRSEGREYVAVSPDGWMVNGGELTLSWKKLIHLRNAIQVELEKWPEVQFDEHGVDGEDG